MFEANKKCNIQPIIIVMKRTKILTIDLYSMIWTSIFIWQTLLIYKDFFSNKTFDKCNVIYLNQFVLTDNDQIYYYNKSLFEIFPK